MTTLTLSLTTSDGHTVEVPYTLPASVRFDCFVPEVGICAAHVDVSAEEVEVTDIIAPGGNSLSWGSRYYDMPEVIEQAGAVCWVVESLPRLLERKKTEVAAYLEPDALPLQHIVDVAWHEQKAVEALHALSPVLRIAVPQYARQAEPSAQRLLHALIHSVLVERAQDMATKAAQKRQREWEAQQAEHLREARCDDREEYTGAGSNWERL